jgi:hypothetical protein
VLTDDLLSLPELARRLAEAQGRTEARLAELAEAQGRTEARLAELAEAQGRTEARLAELAEAQGRTEARLAELAEAQGKMEARLATTEGSVGDLKGLSLETRLAADLRRYVPRQLAVRPNRVTNERFEQLLSSLDEAAVQELQRADALVEAEEPGTGVPVVLVIEAAWTAHVDDVERAARRAGLLTSAGVPAMGLVVSQADPAPQVLEAAQKRSVALTSEAKGLLAPSRPSPSP